MDPYAKQFTSYDFLVIQAIGNWLCKAGMPPARPGNTVRLAEALDLSGRMRSAALSDPPRIRRSRGSMPLPIVSGR